MYSILEEFAYGNISPETQSFTKHSRFGQAVAAVASNEEKLFAKLNEEDKVLLEKLIDAQSEVNQLTAVKNLVYGYKLGVLMTAEAFVTGGEFIAGGE